MTLQRGEVLDYDFDRIVVEFTMLNQGKTVRRAISTAAMDDLEDKRDVKLGHIRETESLLPGLVHFNPQYWPA